MSRARPSSPVVAAGQVAGAPGAPLTATGGLLSQDPYKECGLATDGERVAVGTPLASGGGSVTVYRVSRSGGIGLVPEATLSPPEGAAGGGAGVADLAGFSPGGGNDHGLSAVGGGASQGASGGEDFVIGVGEDGQ